MRLVFSRVASEQFNLIRLIVSLTAAQLIASVVSRYLILTRGQLFPADLPNPLVVVAATPEDATVALVAAAVTALLLIVLGERWHRFPLRLLTVFSYVHCTLLAINVIAVRWLGGPITLQWLYVADLLRSHTPRSAIVAVATSENIAISGIIATTPLWTGLVARLATYDEKSKARLSWFACAMFVGGALLVASAAVLQLGRGDFTNFRESPVQALAGSFFTATPDFLQETPRPTSEEYVAVPSAAPVTGGPGDPNIILIVLESVGAKALEAERRRLPTLGKLMTEGRYFPNTYVATASSPRSLFSLMVSRYPLLGKSRETQSLRDEKFALLPEVLQWHGYNNAFFGVDLEYGQAGQFIQKNGFAESHDVLEGGCNSRRGELLATGAVADDCLFGVPRSGRLDPPCRFL